MRKIAAVASFAFLGAGAANAAGVEAQVSGYMNAGVGLIDAEGATDSFGIFRDGELHFNMTALTDNGLTLRARVELEAFSSGDQIDENWVSVGGKFGTLLFGGADTALNEHGGVGVVYPSGYYFNYYDGTAFDVPGDPRSMVGKDDAIGVRYWYSLAGFEAGVSYQPDANTDSALDSNNLVFENDDQTAVGAKYAGRSGDLRFALGGGYLWNGPTEMAHAGVELAYMGFTVAGFYDRENRANTPAGRLLGGDLDRFGLGAQYETGPWSLGGGYTLTDRRGGRGDDDFAQVGAAYDLAPGVTAFGAMQWGHNERDVEGYGVFSGLNLRF
ncbi:MAG: porin [Paracoccaceae bacterium]